MGVTLALLIAPGADLANLKKRTAYLLSHPRVERAWAIDVDDYAQVKINLFAHPFSPKYGHINDCFYHDTDTAHCHVCMELNLPKIAN